MNKELAEHILHNFISGECSLHSIDKIEPKCYDMWYLHRLKGYGAILHYDRFKIYDNQIYIKMFAGEMENGKGVYEYIKLEDSQLYSDRVSEKIEQRWKD